MIRPVSIGYTSFKGSTIIGGESSKEKEVVNKQTAAHNMSLTTGEKYSFLAGMILGLSTAGVGTTLYQSNRDMNMLNDMMTEINENSVDSMRVEDYNGDKIPDIILVGKDGMSTIYDIKSKKIYMGADGEMEEKIY